MNIQDKTIAKGFILSGLMNLTVLIFSRFFSNSTIPEYDPVVMSNFGLLMIVIWGLAYISIAYDYEKVKWLVAVFAIEKSIYGYIWIKWMLDNNVSEVYEKDIMAGLFYSIYGINDLIFCVFFLLVFIKTTNITKVP
ncbi:hypothetical protein [Cyclobacterium qasimii]|uniref:Uncharacterized protein n=2 Tax=Cyclobacterium qasimii TaxID=1350429 RepID=S7VFH1_9BACT|nr:hypothetical protein [Cyclobacterium qasimii]EPR68282.1 hypothetical protein ADICYQ_2752 [Cyclobacterium qasimii M12-11B]GEO19846.1 hypothetical protein CQA01_03800 [Cyclobacterium qasimii]